MKKTVIYKMHYCVYTCEEWSYIINYLEHFSVYGVKYRTRHGNITGYVEVIILCTDEMLKAIEDVTANKTINYV